MSTKKILDEKLKNYLVWGIVSSQETHRIAWNINRLMDFKLYREEDIIVTQKETAEEFYYPLFKYENETDVYTILLLKNQFQGIPFIKEIRSIDYLLLLEGETDFFYDPEIFTDLLKKIPGIQHALFIPSNQIKSKNIFYIS